MEYDKQFLNITNLYIFLKTYMQSFNLEFRYNIIYSGCCVYITYAHITIKFMNNTSVQRMYIMVHIHANIISHKIQINLYK